MVTGHLALSENGLWPAQAGPASGLYVMVASNGLSAKVGAVERVDRALGRLREVERKQRTRVDDPSTCPLHLAVVMELEGLFVNGADGDEMWAIATHLESALRFALARRLGRLAAWPDWIHIDEPIPLAAGYPRSRWPGITSDRSAGRSEQVQSL